MKKSPVGAGTFCPLSILIFYILLCWKYLPVSEAGPSLWRYRKIPEDPQIKNVRKNCRRFTAWGGKVQDQQSQEQYRWFSLFFIDYLLFFIDYLLLFIVYSLLITVYSLLISVYSLLIIFYSL